MKRKVRISRHDKLEHQIRWNLWLFDPFALLCSPALLCVYGTNTYIQHNLLSGGSRWAAL